MRLDIQTLALILSLIFVAQVIALFVQYKVNRTYRGIGWWLLGSTIMSLGVVFMLFIEVSSLQLLARIANPLVILGQIFLYIGIMHFLEMKWNRKILTSILTISILLYFYYMVVDNDISGRTVVVSTTLAIVLFMCAFNLFFKKNRIIARSADFTASVFFVYGCFLTVRTILTLILPSINSYTDLGQAWIHVFAYIVPIVASTLWTFGFIIMVNQRLNAEISEERERFQQVFNTSPDAATITQLSNGLFVDVNDGFSIMSGYSREEVIGTSSLKIHIWNDPDDRQIFITELKNNGSCKDVEIIVQCKDGHKLVGMMSARIIIIHTVSHIVSVIRDITESKQVEEDLMESEEKYRSILNASPDDITITDLNGLILMVSPASKKMFGYEQEFDGFIGMRLVDFIVPEDHERAQSNIRLMYQGGYTLPNEYSAVRKDKSVFDIEVKSGFVHNSNGQPIKMVFIVRDISERKQAEYQIQHLIQQLEIERNIAQLNSITDSLTGLSNRRYFDETLIAEFYRMKRAGSTLSLMMLDVDNFKKFNDRNGHLAGDDCLRQIGAILKIIVGGVPDIVARYGGEEFVVILPDTKEDRAIILAERIRKAVEEIAIQCSISNIEEYVTVSIGVVTVYTTGLTSPEQVVAMADSALYCAKNGGRNRIEVAVHDDNTDILP